MAAMSEAEKFKFMGASRLAFLEHYGFARRKELEVHDSTLSTLVYAAKKTAIVFNYDIRDSVVDAKVVLMRDGSLTSNYDGGYSSDIYHHLVTRYQYRGGFGKKRTAVDDKSRIELALDAWIELLQDAGQVLLRDEI